VGSAERRPMRPKPGGTRAHAAAAVHIQDRESSINNMTGEQLCKAKRVREGGREREKEREARIGRWSLAVRL